MPDQPQNASDDVAVGPVLLWGIGSLLAMIIIAVVVGAYFWVEREKQDLVKVRESRSNKTAVVQGSLEAAVKLSGYVKVGETYQVPIDRAMELVVIDYQKGQQ